MRLPKLSPPVKRPDIIQPYKAVDIIHGRISDLVSIRMDLLHGANYNDPASYSYGGYSCGQVGSPCYGGYGSSWFR